VRLNQSGRDRNLGLNSWCNADKGIYLYLEMDQRDRLNHRIFGQPQVTLIIWGLIGAIAQPALED
jgi:hypothetical protein